MKPSSQFAGQSSRRNVSRKGQPGEKPLRYVPAHLRQDRAVSTSPDAAGLSGQTARTLAGTQQGTVPGVSRFRRATKLDQGRFTKCRYLLLGFAMFAAIFALSSGLYTRYEVYRNRRVEVAANNTYILSPMSSYFCEAVQASSDSAYNLTLQLFSRKPALSGMDNLTISKTPLVLLPQTGYYMVDFFLNEGSTVTTEACQRSAGTARFFIFDSLRQYKLWLGGDEEQYHFRQEIADNCSISSPYTITAGEDTLFIFRWQNDSPGNIAVLEFVHVYVKRRKYDLNSTELKECWVQPSCSLSTEYSSSEYAGLTVGWRQDGSWHDEIFFTWQCVPRDWLYVVAFGLPSVLLLLIVLVSWWIVSRTTAKKEGKKGSDGEGARLLVSPTSGSLSVNVDHHGGRLSAEETP